MADLDKLFGPIINQPKDNKNGYLLLEIGLLLGGIFLGYRISNQNNIKLKQVLKD